MRVIFLLLLSIFLYASNITKTKRELKSTKNTIQQMNQKLGILAKNIIQTQQKLKNINQQIEKLNQQITNLEKSLKNSSQTLQKLNKIKNRYITEREKVKKKIETFIAQNYYLDSQKINTLNDLIYTTLTEKILKEYSKNIETLIKRDEAIKKNINQINAKMKKIKAKKAELEKTKKQLLKLKKEQLAILHRLKQQKALYKKRLQNMLAKQQRLQKKLAEFKIIKQKGEKITISSQPIKVKQIGTGYLKVKVTTYRGPKTIPPVRGKIIKKFGSYIDPIYKIRIYNDSITIKTEPNALIRAIFPGKIIYIGEEGDKKIVFIKHKHNLFSIYANLSKVSPLIKKGSYVKKGQIIGRVKNSLEFEVTYKDKAINPLQVINLK